jgi:beta-glucuronidase
MLAPRDSTSRDCRRLDGVWRFRVDALDEGTSARWWGGSLPGVRNIAVPASYNDLCIEDSEREHVGDVWYQREVRVPATWHGRGLVLRCDAVTHRGTVWVDDAEVATHVGGYTPFEADISALAEPGATFRLTIRVNSELDMTTIPPGVVSVAASGRKRQRYFHDFFNYSGIHRSVSLYATPQHYIADVAITTELDVTSQVGRVDYRVDVVGAGETSVVLLDDAGNVVGECSGAEGSVLVPHVRAWSPREPNLYQLQIRHGSDADVDEYVVPVGIRTVHVSGGQLLLNGEPVYLRGFGMHEDRALRGKGHDDARMIRDFALLKWIGANSFRTSHYPYAEEVLDHADREGILVIDEVPAVGLHLSLGNMGDAGAKTFRPGAIGDEAQSAHLQAIDELIRRDRNHPCVIAWSLANEPDTAEPAARDYFVPLVAAARRLDPSRPVCFANVATAPPELDVVTDLFDIVCLNRYYGWYVDTGDIESAEINLEAELHTWARYGKPIVITEFGADALAGLHALPPTLWSEDYQVELVTRSMRVFRRIPEVVGEHIWNFADFATTQAVHRPGGNHKGVFTRDRQPKAIAWRIRELWRQDSASATPDERAGL